VKPNIKQIGSSIQNWFFHLSGEISLKPGIYHFQRQNDREKVRLHLRVENDLAGLLLVNASRIFHLNPTAAHLAFFTLIELPIDQVIDQMVSRFRVSKKQAQTDYGRFLIQFNTFLNPDETCPIHDLGLEVIQPFSSRPSAPYRMDLALTYRCQNSCAHCYNARPPHYPEMSLQSWKQVIDKLWNIGIPHIVFTGGEPTLFEYLPELIFYAENKGQITGINTNGRRLKDTLYLKSLSDAGLDHIQITVESHNPAIHDEMVGVKGAWLETREGLRNALKSGLFVMTNTTLLASNSQFLEQTLDFLADEGAKTIGLNALIHAGRGLSIQNGLTDGDLPQLLKFARNFTEEHHQRLIWYTPTQYCKFDPVQLELGVKGCTAALYNMCIEPDGSVIPCQSYYQSVGNILTSPWVTIWNNDISTNLRERRNLPHECNECGFRIECAGGCPLSRQANTSPMPSAILPIPNY
jgi:radical SAM protein with 4Fe4S-binding SPASM domain